jgi:hypothetical protein
MATEGRGGQGGQPSERGLTGQEIPVEYPLLTTPTGADVELFKNQIKQWCGRTSQFGRVDRISREPHASEVKLEQKLSLVYRGSRLN